MLEISKAVDLWNAGLTMTQIGKELSLTKGQVAGTISRNRDLFDRRVVSNKRIEAHPAIADEIKIQEPRKPINSSPRLYQVVEDAKPKDRSPTFLAHQRNKISMAHLDATGETLPKSEIADAMEILRDVDKNKKGSNALRKMFSEASAPAPRSKANDAAYDQERLQYAVTMADLDTRKCCTWPVTDNPKGVPNRFCAEVKAGKNYCRVHNERQWRVT